MREGPWNEEEFAANRGWLSNMTDIGPASRAPAPSFSARAALDGNGDYGSVARNAPRVVGCTAVGEDALTGLPVTVTAPPKLLLVLIGWNYRPRLIDFRYPMPFAEINAWFRTCVTDADCAGAPAGGMCACDRDGDCTRKLCQERS